MAIDKVREYLKKYNKDKDIQEFDVSSATVELAALALGCAPERIAKTLSFIVNEAAVLIVTAGDTKIDNSKFKYYFGAKAKMIPSDDLESFVGHKAGGVCPFAVKGDVKIYFDKSLKRFDYVYPACGSANSAIKLTIEELEDITNYLDWIDVSKKVDS